MYFILSTNKHINKKYIGQISRDPYQEKNKDAETYVNDKKIKKELRTFEEGNELRSGC